MKPVDVDVKGKVELTQGAANINLLEREMKGERCTSMIQPIDIVLKEGIELAQGEASLDFLSKGKWAPSNVKSGNM